MLSVPLHAPDDLKEVQEEVDDIKVQGHRRPHPVIQRKTCAQSVTLISPTEPAEGQRSCLQHTFSVLHSKAYTLI